jgi:hypothetical protein
MVDPEKKKALGCEIHLYFLIYTKILRIEKLNEKKLSRLLICDPYRESIPAELKHISKRRKRNQKGFP